MDQKKEDVTQVSPSVQGACTPGGINIWTRTTETSPDTKPPQEKRARREALEEEPEEGEITDSSDEEKEEEEGNADENASCNKCCDSAGSPVNDTNVIKNQSADS